VVLVGSRRALAKAVRTDRAGRRWTLLPSGSAGAPSHLTRLAVRIPTSISLRSWSVPGSPHRTLHAGRLGRIADLVGGIRTVGHERERRAEKDQRGSGRAWRAGVLAHAVRVPDPLWLARVVAVRWSL
jgi:hypothetical protein